MSRHSFTAPTPEALGELLPAYDFECLIAKGGMGAVYRANQRSLARHVAIKILPREFGQDPQFKASFATEARAMARLNHPNLISVYDSGAVDGMLYIVMEYVPGKSLYHSAYGKKVDPVQAAELVQGICDGLGHAHDNGTIHRDIKPSNVLLTAKAEPKIGDFGLARPIGAAGSGLIMGTPGYTAPEVLSDPQVADRRSDLFAVGVILYELVTGQRQEPDAPPPSTFCGCGPGIDEIWRCATHPNPALRYADAKEFHAALAAWVAKFKAAAGKPGLVPTAPGRARPVAAPRVLMPKVGTPPKAAGHFNLKLLILAGLIIGIAVVWKQGESGRASRQQLEEQAAAAKQRELEAAKPPPLVPADPADPTPPAVAGPKQETPLEALARLRYDLAAGKRTEMPPGVIQRADCDFMLVPTPMTWSEAAWFAENCGGHLAIPTSNTDLSWLGQLAPGENYVWLGGGRSGRDVWTFLNGTFWQKSPLPSGTGTHVAVSQFGLMQALDSKTALPFLIQWHRDGSNPGAIATALRAAGKSLGEANPVFPPGTEGFDHRHYLYVAQPVRWREAMDMAELSGGHLAVASDAAEIAQLRQFTDSVVAPDGIWLGASLKVKAWHWVTNELWGNAGWAGGTAPTDGTLGLLCRPQQGWDSQNLSLPASGFIIEWSADRERKAASAPGAAPAPELAAAANLTQRARELVTAADRKRSEQMAANVRTLTWDLDLWLRSLSASDKGAWQLPVARLKAAVRNSRVPAAVPRESGIILSAKMAQAAATAAEKQEQINAAFLAEVAKLRAAYLVKVKAAIPAADAAGLTTLAASLRAGFKDATDNETWLKSFGIDPTANAPVLTAPEK